MSETPHVPPSPPPGGSYSPPPPPPPSGGTSAGGDRTLMVVLSYLWILSLIPLLAKKDDPEVQWHAKNGLALLGAEIVAWIVFLGLGYAFRGMFGCGLGVMQCAIWIAFFVVRIICIVKGVNGQRLRIPIITDMAEKM